MGNIVGGIIGGVGSLLGGSSAKSNALAGFNYLTGKNGTQPIVNNATAASNEEAQLLGTQPVTDQTKAAFGNYLGSTGYNFIKQQGTSAITGNAASRGILNSGATAKALQRYGTGLASTTFNDYLNHLSGMTGQGVQAAGSIGAAGTQGGEAAGKAMNSGIGNAFGTLAGIATSLI